MRFHWIVHRILVDDAVEVLNAGFRCGHDQPGVDRPPPCLGEHTREVLAELGYSPKAIETIANRAGAS